MQSLMLKKIVLEETKKKENIGNGLIDCRACNFVAE